MIYFDNSATTPIHPLALETYKRTSERIIGNPSSLHHLGSQATRLLNQVRKQIAEDLHCSEQEIFFTSGGTEGNNWVIKGTAFEKASFGKHIIISAIEHASVRRTVEQLEKIGFEVDTIPVNQAGVVDVSILAKLIRSETILVSVMAVNNEIGSIQPIQAISDLLMDYPTIHFHVDAVQALGKVPTANWLTDRVDFATFSAHKFHGPKGVGFIYKRAGKRIEPLMAGGGQEMQQRSGTENVAGIVAMAKALHMHLQDTEKKQHHQQTIKEYLTASLKDYEAVSIYSQTTAQYAPHILCFGIRGIRGEVLVHALEEKEVILSTTSACSSKKASKTGTLSAMGIAPELASSAVRLSLSEKSTMAEAEQFMIVFKQLYTRFQQLN